MTSAEVEWSFPDTLEGFGYAFNKDGQLRKIDPNTGKPGNEPFEFNISEDQDYNQKRYEALGDVITEYVYGLLETEVGLHRMMVPHQGPMQESAAVFVSSDILLKPDHLLVLIPGSGAVKSGQWSRSLIINDSLQSGSQIPFIKRARELGYAVVVMNPNENVKVTDGKLTKIKATQYFSDFRSNVFAIALTDSVHNLRIQKVPSKVTEYLRKVSRNWASHNTPLDTPVPHMMDDDIPRVSAGHTRHEMTSWSSFESVFTFLQERYSSLAGKEEL